MQWYPSFPIGNILHDYRTFHNLNPQCSFRFHQFYTHSLYVCVCVCVYVCGCVQFYHTHRFMWPHHIWDTE